MRTNYHKYTDTEKQWLIENICKCTTYKHLTDMFNEKFHTSVSQTSIQDVCTKRLHIHRGVNSGIFKKGEQNARTYNLGDEREYNGYIWIKTNDIHHKGKVTFSMFCENWTPKHRHIYEQHYGRIQDDNIVVFLDGDNRNFDIDNLYCISRRISAMMSSNRWFTCSREHTMVAIRYCELMLALADNLLERK